MGTEVTDGTLTRIVRSVFSTMMETDISTSQNAWLPATDRLTSFVQLTGDWNGAVLLECSEQQACRFAAKILCMDEPSAIDDDVRDVLGEIANMIGGNMKSELPLGVCLSMPTVMNGTDFDLRICGTHIQERLAFEFDDGHFWVTILTTDSFTDETIFSFPTKITHSDISFT